MAVPEQALEAKLKATSTVTDLVAARVYPGYRPGGTALPAIVYDVTQDVPSNHATGTTGTAQMFVSLSCIATTYAGAKALGAAVRTAINGWTDTDGRVWHMTGESEDIGEPLTGTSVPEYCAVDQDYTVWH